MHRPEIAKSGSGIALRTVLPTVALVCLGAAAQNATPQGGYAIGGFVLSPSIEIGYWNDSNVYRSNAELRDAPGDSVFSARPKVDLYSGWSRHQLRGTAGLYVDRHTDFDTEDTVDAFGEFAGRLDVNRSIDLEFDVDAARLHEPRGDPDTATGIAEPLKYSRQGFNGAAVLRPGRWHVKLGMHVDGLSYDDGRTGNGDLVVQSDRDRVEREYTLELGVRPHRCGRLFVRHTHYNRSYDSLTRGFDRDSSGNAQVIGGAYDVTSLILLEVFIGNRTQDLDDAGLPSLDGFIYGLTLNYQPTMLTTVEAQIERTIEESALANASGFMRTAAELALTHRLTRSLTLRGRFGAENRDYQGVPNEYDQRFWSVEAIYQRNPRLQFSAGYTSDTRDANPTRDDYERSVPFLRLRLSL